MIHEIDCYAQKKYQNLKCFKYDQKCPMKKKEMYQTSLRGEGGYPPLVKKTNYFRFFHLKASFREAFSIKGQTLENFQNYETPPP